MDIDIRPDRGPSGLLTRGGATYKLAAVKNSTIEQKVLNIATVDENRNIIPFAQSQLRQTTP